MFGAIAIIGEKGTSIASTELIIHTTSQSSVWTPSALVNTGTPLTWSVSGSITIPETEYTGNFVPIYDFSGNTGTAIITIKSSSLFENLTEFRVDGTDTAGDITFIDVKAATDLVIFSCKYQPYLTSIDITTLTSLQSLTLRDNALTSIDISNNSNLINIWIYGNGLTSFDVSSTLLLVLLKIRNNYLDDAELDQLIKDLDANNQTDGNLEIDYNTGQLTSDAYTEYQNLTYKRWKIDVFTPTPPQPPPSGGKTPLIYNFRIPASSTNKVYFDSTEVITGSTINGFTIGGKAFPSTDPLYINSGQLTGHYFVLNSTLSFWDNTLIRYEGREQGNTSDIRNLVGTYLYDFRIQYIENSIPEPSTSNNYYVAIDGDDAVLLQNNNINNPWRTIAKAAELTPANSTVHIKAGNYGNDVVVLPRDGNPDGPIKFIGYQTTPLDSPSINKSDLHTDNADFDSSVMPLLEGSSGHQWDMQNRSNIIIKNIQFQDCGNTREYYAIRQNECSNVVLENVYMREGYRGVGGGDNIDFTKVLDCYVANMHNSGIILNGSHNLLKDTWAITNEISLPANENYTMDYYLIVQGVVSGSFHNCVKSCTVKRIVGNGHTGHAIALKARNTDSIGENPDPYQLEYNLIEDCYVEHATPEFRHRGCKFNVIRRLEVRGNMQITAGNAKIVTMSNGCSYNYAEDCHGHDIAEFVRFYETAEDGTTTPQQAGHHNTIINCTAYNGNMIILDIYSTGSTGINDNLPSTYNRFINCTFYDFNYIYSDGYSHLSRGFYETNTFLNCNFINVGSEVYLTPTGYDARYSYSNFYPIPSGMNNPPAGAGNVNLNPEFADAPNHDFNLSANTPIEIYDGGSNHDELWYDIEEEEREEDKFSIGAHEYDVIEDDGLYPVLDNFTILNDYPNLIQFTSSKPITATTIGTTATDGFLIEGETVQSITINSDGMSGYITIADNQHYWSNILIRYEGGSDIKDELNRPVHPFLVQYIDNQIAEPTTANTYYVDKATGDDNVLIGDNDINNPWKTITKAASTVTSNSTVWIKAGNYGSETVTVTTDGEVDKPIKFIGYKTTIGDAIQLNRENLHNGTDDLDSTEMPLMDNGSAHGISLKDRDYIIIRNIQFVNYTTGGSYSIFTRNVTNAVIDNCYFKEGDRSVGGLGSDLNKKIRIINSYVENMSSSGATITGSHNLIMDSWCVSTRDDVDMDYYFSVLGASNAHSNSVRNCKIDRIYHEDHPGHGVTLKANETTNLLQYCLVENIEVNRAILEFRHSGTKYNVMRNITAKGSYNIGSLESGGYLASFRDGCSYNVVENSTGTNLNAGIRLLNNTGEDLGQQAGGHYNKVINSVFYKCAMAIFDNGLYGDTLESTYNNFINCTFVDIGELFTFGAATKYGSTNKFINCIFNDIISKTDESSNFTPLFTYNDFYDNGTWDDSIIGTNDNIGDNPDFVDLIDFVPQETNLKAGIATTGAEYDKDGVERNNPPTMGAIEI